MAAAGILQHHELECNEPGKCMFPRCRNGWERTNQRSCGWGIVANNGGRTVSRVGKEFQATELPLCEIKSQATCLDEIVWTPIRDATQFQALQDRLDAASTTTQQHRETNPKSVVLIDTIKEELLKQWFVRPAPFQPGDGESRLARLVGENWTPDQYDRCMERLCWIQSVAVEGDVVQIARWKLRLYRQAIAQCALEGNRTTAQVIEMMLYCPKDLGVFPCSECDSVSIPYHVCSRYFVCKRISCQACWMKCFPIQDQYPDLDLAHWFCKACVTLPIAVSKPIVTIPIMTTTTTSNSSHATPETALAEIFRKYDCGQLTAEQGIANIKKLMVLNAKRTLAFWDNGE
ncbi:hypothetical protein BASA81_012498 [Batrachochytrium salamandrivorans]|nr:hypothetical protein BASA81_012498 [Batrachochytrium salamandrivorans]